MKWILGEINIYTEKFPTTFYIWDTLMLLKLMGEMIKLLRSFYTAVLEPTNCRRANILVFQVVGRWRHVRWILVDIEPSRSHQDRKRISAVPRNHLPDRQDSYIDFDLRLFNDKVLFLKFIDSSFAKISRSTIGNFVKFWMKLFCNFTYKMVARATKSPSQCTQLSLRRPTNVPHCNWTLAKLQQQSASKHRSFRQSFRSKESEAVDIELLCLMGGKWWKFVYFANFFSSFSVNFFNLQFSFHDPIGLQKSSKIGQTRSLKGNKSHLYISESVRTNDRLPSIPS